MSESGQMTRPLKRDVKTYRDDRRFVVACEDTFAPKQYFEIFRLHRVQVLVLGTIEGFSAPQHVLNRLLEFKEAHAGDIQEDDQFWLFLDTDHWIEANHISGFVQIIKQAKTHGIFVAGSNPCFDFWLLLHHAEPPAIGFKRCEEVGAAIKKLCGEFNKSRLRSDHYSEEKVFSAISRAEAMDEWPGQHYPKGCGTHVYHLAKEIWRDALSRHLLAFHQLTLKK